MSLREQLSRLQGKLQRCCEAGKTSCNDGGCPDTPALEPGGCGRETERRKLLNSIEQSLDSFLALEPSSRDEHRDGPSHVPEDIDKLMSSFEADKDFCDSFSKFDDDDVIIVSPNEEPVVMISDDDGEEADEVDIAGHVTSGDDETDLFDPSVLGELNVLFCALFTAVLTPYRLPTSQRGAHHEPQAKLWLLQVQTVSVSLMLVVRSSTSLPPSLQ